MTVARGAVEDVGPLADATRGADAVLVSITGLTPDVNFVQYTPPRTIPHSRLLTPCTRSRTPPSCGSAWAAPGRRPNVA